MERLTTTTRTVAVDTAGLTLPPPLLHPAVPLPADRHPVKVYLARLDVNSRRTMRAAVEAAAVRLTGGVHTAETLPWAMLDYQHMLALRSQLATQYAPATANRILTAVRGVLQECRRLGFMPLEQQLRAGEVPPVRGQRVPKGRMLAADEIAQLFRVCAADDGPAGRRDAALLAMLYGAGLRRTEAVNLDVADYDLTTGQLLIRCGKGRKDRQLFAGNGTATAVREWLAVRAQDPGPLFVPIGKSGRLFPRRLSDKAVTHILQERAAEATITAFSPHDLRRSYISTLLASGVDLVTVSALAGHASVTTTATYDRRGDEAKRQAAERLVVPFVSGCNGS
jgi:site-specific recombinase XerD